jgi:hypothetical protein
LSSTSPVFTNVIEFNSPSFFIEFLFISFFFSDLLQITKLNTAVNKYGPIGKVISLPPRRYDTRHNEIGIEAKLVS